MDKVLAKLQAHLERGVIDAPFCRLLTQFYHSYCKEGAAPHYQRLFETLVDHVLKQKQHPHSFSILHKAVRAPFDFYQFGLDFIRPYVDFAHSRVEGLEHLATIQKQLKAKESVVLLANHQTEPDPQIISLLIEKIDPSLACEMIFVAGHRVTTDPVAIPLSLGRNLLCIYSKKHIAHPPEQKSEKTIHNQRTMKMMQQLLNEGGHCIYVAPSGGRDRKNAAGKVEVAPFDPQSVELFYLMAKQAERPVHLYPLALDTYALMPPPRSVEKELGERREIYFSPVRVAFGSEIDLGAIPGLDGLDKREQRKKRAEYIWQQVCGALQWK